ncbi:extracellular solute-binding protein family 1 [Sphaerochaeta globosa str. Buddy]|uniref:Extracellular solute-binding protein family 1 n=2 Tax=Sphaerochaeta TaxID=399320 RepID=F0RWC3_SPHGB|nr:extracellular solute-binding protein family 1 [Sphaerochaeta globosa str. Buddy]
MHKMFRYFSILVVCLLMLTGMGCRKPAQQNSKLYLYNWTYYTPDALVAQFEKETGIDVVIDNFASNEEMFAKIMAGGNEGYDLIFPSSDYTAIMIKLGLLTELDHTMIPNLKYLSPLFREKADYDPAFRYSVPYFMGSSGIAVNTQRAPAGYERTWDIFSDIRMAGSMSMLDDMREVMGAALKHLGYSGNSIDRDQLQQAADLINTKWKPNLVKFDSESFGKAFSRGEFVVVHAYPENVFAEISKEKWSSIDFFIPPEGGMMYIDNMVIPKGSRNLEAAHAFINFIHEPKNYAVFLDTFSLPPTTNTGAAAFMKTEQPFFSIEDLSHSDNISDLGSDLELYNQLWQVIRYH